MTAYCFDVEVAEKVGLDAAIILQAMEFWISKNEANGRNQHDGNTWTYNSVAAWAKIFPFWSKPQITRKLNKMIDDGLLVTGNYNNNPYDRTLWYALTDQAKSICRNREMKKTESVNENPVIVEPIPVNKPVNNHYGAHSRHFHPPTVQEVADYAAERRYQDFNAERFVSYHESRGWTVGRGKMKDWRAAVRYWASDDRKGGNGSKESDYRKKMKEYTLGAI